MSKPTAAAAILTAALLAGCASSKAPQGPATVITLPRVETRVEYVAQPNSREHRERPRYHKNDMPPLAAAAQARKDGTFVPRASDYIGTIYEAPYVRDWQYDLYTAIDMMSIIDLEEGEVPTGIFNSNKELFEIQNGFSGPEGSMVYQIMVKPRRAGQKTRLLITTNRRPYIINVKSFKYDHHVGMRFTYPEREMARINASLAREHKEGGRGDLLPGCRSAGWKVVGSGVPWLPQPTSDGMPAVCDDGTKLRINFPANLGAIAGPSVFEADDAEGANARMVNFRVIGTSYVVDGTPRALILREGMNKVAIVRQKG